MCESNEKLLTIFDYRSLLKSDSSAFKVFSYGWGSDLSKFALKIIVDHPLIILIVLVSFYKKTKTLVYSFYISYLGFPMYISMMVEG